MKYTKTLGLLAVAATALMAFAGTASATLTEGEGDFVDAGDVIHASIEGALSHTTVVTITCQESTFSVEAATNDATVAGGPIKSLTYEECNHTVTVNKPGELKIESTGSNTGRLVFSGTEVTALVHNFLLGTVHCIYVANNTALGTITGTGHEKNSKTEATLDIFWAEIPQEPTDGVCGEHATLDGSYVFSTPQHLLID